LTRRIAPVSWLASKDASHPHSLSVFPGIVPVAEGSVLAYSCAAARDFHPLPCLRRAAKTRVPKKLIKSRTTRRM